MARTLQARLIPLLLLSLLATSAQAAGLGEVVRALERPFQTATPAGQRIRDYRATFVQEARIAALDRLQRARGEVSVRFDDRGGQTPTVMFRWEYREPTPQELVSDGRTLWVYLPENHQVIVSDLRAAAAQENDPMAFLTGLGNLSRDFQIGFAEPDRDSAGNFILELRPRRATALIERMLTVVDRAAVVDGTAPRGGPLFPIVSTTVYDTGGNSTTIAFSDLRLNRGLTAGQFEFVLPAGVEVIRPPGREPGQ